MSRIWRFTGGDQELKTYSKKTFQALQKVKEERLTRVSVGLREGVINAMRKRVKGSATMQNDQLLIKYLNSVLKN